MSDEGSGSGEAAIGCDATQIDIKNENSMDIKMEMPDMMDDSLDGGPPSVGSGEIMMGQCNSMSGTIIAPVSAKKAKKDGKKLVTGYILYSSDVRRSVAANNPDSSFGDVSRIVGNEWRNLPQEVKTAWEEKAAKMNEEMAAKLAEAEANSQAAQIGPNHVVPATEPLWECCWESCDFQFEDMSDCIEHCVGSGPDPNGHVHTYFASVPSDSEWQCQWRNCGRIKKGAQPFPNLQRLARHVKEVHIQKSAGRIIPMHERSKNFVLSRKPRPVSQLTQPQNQQHQTLMNHGGMSNANHVLGQSRNTPSPHSQFGSSISVMNQQPPKPMDPLFVSVPPKPQRLLHSEAYIKYIEGLSAENRSINNWEKQLKARPENTPVPDPSRLPGHWLANGVGNHGTMVNALWTLRDFMVRDALGISKLV